MKDDRTLILEYVRDGSEEAFAALAAAHIDLVYSVALRQVRDPHLAQEITQVVFIILARKAKMFDAKTILPGWLCRTARYASANMLTIQRRRHIREQEAQQMQSIPDEPNSNGWNQIAAHLDDALGCLAVKDHSAIVLRYFQNRSFGEVASELGTSEGAAKMRVNRALEKLRKFFTKRGVTVSSALIAGAVSANSVQAAPAGLAASVSCAAIKGTAVTATTMTALHGVLKLMAWAEAKTAIGVGAAVLVAAATVAVTTVALKRTSASPSPAVVQPVAQFQKPDPAGKPAPPPIVPPTVRETAAISDAPQPGAQAIPAVVPSTPPPVTAVVTAPKRAVPEAAPVYPNTPRLSVVMAGYRAADGSMGSMPPEVILKNQYGNMFQLLQLTPGQIAGFYKIQEDRQARTADLTRQHAFRAGDLQGLDSAAVRIVMEERSSQMEKLLEPINHDADVQIELLLASEDSYRYYRIYTDQRRERMVVMNGYRDGLAAAHIPPLTLVEDEELVSLVYQERIAAKDDADIEARGAPQIMQQAASFLSPEQVKVFGKYLPLMLAPATGAVIGGVGGFGVMGGGTGAVIPMRGRQN